MKPSRLLFAVTILASALLFTLAVPTATAAAPKKPVPPPDMRKLIKSVDVAGGAIVIVYMHHKMTHTYKIDDVTSVTVNNSPGKIGDIKPGMEVTDYIERDNDSLDSISLKGTGTKPAPAVPKQKT